MIARHTEPFLVKSKGSMATISNAVSLLQLACRLPFWSNAHTDLPLSHFRKAVELYESAQHSRKIHNFQHYNDLMTSASRYYTLGVETMSSNANKRRMKSVRNRYFELLYPFFDGREKRDALPRCNTAYSVKSSDKVTLDFTLGTGVRTVCILTGDQFNTFIRERCKQNKTTLGRDGTKYRCTDEGEPFVFSIEC